MNLIQHDQSREGFATLILPFIEDGSCHRSGPCSVPVACNGFWPKNEDIDICNQDVGYKAKKKAFRRASDNIKNPRGTMRDKLSRREDRALLKALRAVVLTQFPNPYREDCPGTPVLQAIVTKRISMFDSAHEHIVGCSPCFKELTGIRQRLQRRKILFWAIGTTGAAIVLLAVWITYFGSRALGGDVQPQTVQAERPTESQAPAPIAPSTQPNSEIALLDLRNVSATRTVERSASSSKMPPFEIRRGLLTLTVQLPVGSEAGLYEVEIRNSNQQAIQTTKAAATIESGIATLLINIDTRSIPRGEYEFAWRTADFSWRHQPILIG